MIRRTSLVAALLLATTFASAQGVHKIDIALAQDGKPAAGAGIRVCQAGALSGPTDTATCNPIATIYSNKALTNVTPNPFPADARGNFDFYVSPGAYDLQITFGGITTAYQNYQVPIDTSISPTWKNSQKIYLGTPDQAKNGLTTRVPTHLDIEAGSVATPTVGKYQTSPSLYVSDIGATDASSCITGLAAPCMSALAMFEGTNVSATTSADLVGVFVDLYGAKAATQASGWGNGWVGGAYQVWDSATPNLVALTGLNPNMGALSVPAGCVKGTVGQTTCARSINGMETDITNSTAIDGVFEQSIGNAFSGNTINYYGTNASPADGTVGLTIDTGTVGHGWKIGQILGGVQSVGLLIPQTHITNKPDIGIQIASQGLYGLVIGSGSTSYTHGVSQTLVNPSYAGILLDAKRGEGSTSAATSNNIIFRGVITGTSYLSTREFTDNAGLMHWQSDISNPSTPTVAGTFVDGLLYQPNVVQNSGALTVFGQMVATSAIQLRATGGNFFQLNGTPTGGRTISFQDASYIVAGTNLAQTWSGNQTSVPLVTPTIGGGAAITKAEPLCSGAITPASVNATTCAEQTFTIAACSTLATTDTVLVNQSTGNTSLAHPVGDWRVSSAGVLAHTYCNTTAGALTPTAQTITVWRFR